MEIKKLDLNDAQKVDEFLAVKNNAFKNRSNELYPYIERTKEEFYKRVSNPQSFVIVAVDNDKIIGGAGCEFLCDEPYKRGETFYVCVSPEYQGKGISLKIIEQLHKLAVEENYEILELRVFKYFEGAVHLYEKCGYIKRKLIPSSAGQTPRYIFINNLSAGKLVNIKVHIKYIISCIQFKLLFTLIVIRAICLLLYRKYIV